MPNTASSASASSTDSKQKKSFSSSFLSGPSNVGFSNILFGNNENVKSGTTNTSASNQRGDNNQNNSDNSPSKGSFSLGVLGAIKRTSEGIGKHSDGTSSIPGSSLFTTKKKETSKLNENVPEALDVLYLIEICLMHGIRVKEYHGILPLWTLLERLRLLTPQVVASMSTINSNNNKNNNEKNASSSSVSGNSSDGRRSLDSAKNNKKEKIINSIKNTFDSINGNENTKSNEDGKRRLSESSANMTNNSRNTDTMTPVLTSNPLRQSVGSIASAHGLRSPLAKARAWIRSVEQSVAVIVSEHV